MTEEELAALIDRIAADFVDDQRDPVALTTLCAIELFDALKAALVQGEPQRGYTRKTLREATFARSKKALPNRHVDTHSFTKTPEQVAARLAKRGGFDDPVTGRHLIVAGPTYEARGRTGDPRKYYFVISGTDAAPLPRDTTQPPALGRPTLILHVIQERDVPVSPEEPAYYKLTIEEIVKLETHEMVLWARDHTGGHISAQVEIAREHCSVEKKGEDMYRGRAYAELQLPSSMGVSDLPSFLGVYGRKINAHTVEIRYTPEHPTDVWRAALDVISTLDPQPVPITGNYMSLHLLMAGVDLEPTGVWGAGPGQTRFRAALREDGIVVTFEADDASDLCDAMRGFALKTFLNKHLGLAADY